MANDRDRLRKWADRTSGGGAPPLPPPPSAAPAPPPAVAQPGALPAPPPGYVYGYRPDVGAYVLIPTAPTPLVPQAYPPAPAYPPPAPYAPQAPAYPPQPQGPPGRVLPFPAQGPRPQTCMVVKPGSAPDGFSSDPWADTLAQLPELYPDMTGGHDAMAGRMSPEAAAEVQKTLAAISGESGQPVLIEGIDYATRGGGPPAQLHAPPLAQPKVG